MCVLSECVSACVNYDYIMTLLDDIISKAEGDREGHLEWVYYLTLHPTGNISRKKHFHYKYHIMKIEEDCKLQLRNKRD